MQNDAPNDRRDAPNSGGAAAGLRPGETFADRYRLEERVGSGGMGELFRAFDTRLQRTVALKVLRRDRIASGVGVATVGATASQDAALTEASARILREARAAAALNHPNVVAIHDVGERDGLPFIAMEYVRGKSLRAFVGAPEPSFEMRLEWMIDVARALGAAHERGLVHRDVKPDNVMIRDDGMAKVLDFGIARHHQMGSPESASDLLAAARMPGEPTDIAAADATVSRVLGTPGYMAPEQIRGEACDGRADQFAWGVMAYELFGGKLPWSTEQSTYYTMTAVLAEEVKPLPNVPFHISRAISRALEKKPEKRFASMADLVAACGVRTPSRLPAQTPDVSALLQATTGEAQVVDPSLVQRDVPTARKLKGVRAVARPARALIAGLLLGCAAVGILVAHSASQSDAGDKTRPHASAPAVSSGTVAMTDLRISPTCSKAAEAHYRQGIAAMREATWELALTAFEKAVEEDPSCPEPQLQMLFPSYFRYSVPKERELFHRVNTMRDALSERDGAVLDAFAPLIASEPADREEASRRFDAVVERFPRDPQVLTLASVYGSFGAHDNASVEKALDYARRATALDPKDADGWQQQGGTLVRLGRIDEAMAALDKCLEVAPGSGDCLEDRIRVLRLRGQCSAASAAARQWIASVPQSSSAYRHLANALASEGAPAETVEAALEQLRNKAPEEMRETTYFYHRARLAVLAGNFTAAQKFAEDLSTRWNASASVFDHIRAATFMMNLAIEVGQPARAASMAEQFLRRKEAWTEGFWSSTAYEPLLLATLLQRGTITHDRWNTLLDQWEKSARSTVGRTWGLRWGSVTNTRKAAADVWRSRPPPGPAAGSLEQPMSLRTLSDTFEGRVALMAGEYTAAVDLLGPATKSCDRLEEPFISTRARLWLGEAKEGQGDIAGACAAYEDVLKTWGDAKPRSVTADEARQRRQVLGCKAS